MYVFAARFVRPIHKLNQTVKEVAEGDLTKTTHVQGRTKLSYCPKTLTRQYFT
ncbi:HAMP domain-containing protein [Paenibacillus larvae]|nr:HAMP domain-containing protein [Paenibacillus larvae]